MVPLSDGHHAHGTVLGNNQWNKSSTEEELDHNVQRRVANHRREFPIDLISNFIPDERHGPASRLSQEAVFRDI